MTGVPFHSADVYIEKLVNKNYKIAVCEKLNGGRTVERIITKNPEDNRPVDLETGEFLTTANEELSFEEMRQFYDNMEESEEVPTVSKLIGTTPDEPDTFDELPSTADSDNDFDIEIERQKMKAFDLEAMIILQELFDNKITIV